jgi:hypothetical protein
MVIILFFFWKGSGPGACMCTQIPRWLVFSSIEKGKLKIVVRGRRK